MEDKLGQIFSNVNDWLKYAETKNGILLSLNGAGILGIFSMLKDVPEPFKSVLLWCLIPALCCSLFVSLISFLPITDRLFKKKYDLSDTKLENTNLFFYGDIRKLSVEVYLAFFYQSYQKDEPEVYVKPELDLANQILNNSEITYKKLVLFKISVSVASVGLLGSALFALIYNHLF